MEIKHLTLHSNVKTFLSVGLGLIIILCAAVAPLPGPAATPEAGAHPSLVRDDPSLCMDCHEDMFRNREDIHPPVNDDCTVCHEFSKTDEGTRVGLADEEPALCLACHAELEAAAAAELSNPHPPVGDSCLTCHDPHASQHDGLLLDRVDGICGLCHDPEELNTAHDGQLQEASNCLTCHDPHGSANGHMLVFGRQHVPFEEGSCKACHRAAFGNRIRLRSRGERLCTSCHGEFEPPEGGSVHLALQGESGRAGCLGCHDPHGSDKSSLLSKSVPEMCVSCHGGIVEASLAENGHPAAAEDCMTCHLPHVSHETRLLTAPRDELCAMCHETDDKDLSDAHLGADLAALDCLACHDPHGSEHPKLLAETLHAPVMDGCDTCHEAGYDKVMENGSSSLCFMCHDDIAETVEKAVVPHPAMEAVDCTACHNPHASPHKALIKLPAGGVCTECHEEQAPADGEVGHGVIGMFGCAACHEPHGGDTTGLLRVAGDDLCLSCHEAGRVEIPKGVSEVTLLDRFTLPVETAKQMASLHLSEDGQTGHPLEKHRVSGQPTEKELKQTETTFSGELGCMTCHDPHKGRSEQLFRWDAAGGMQVCMHCHPK